MVELAPTDLLYFDLIAPEAQDATVHEWAVRWARWGQKVGVLGPIARLDLEHRSMTTTLFREPRPKFILILADEPTNKWRNRLPKWMTGLGQLLMAPIIKC